MKRSTDSVNGFHTVEPVQIQVLDYLVWLQQLR